MNWVCAVVYHFGSTEEEGKRERVFEVIHEVCVIGSLLDPFDGAAAALEDASFSGVVVVVGGVVVG